MNVKTAVDTTVIGTGMAGLAAAFFAADLGMSTALVGSTAEIAFASGLIDLLGVHPIGEKRLWENPWDALEALVCDEPNHPYAKIPAAEIAAAIDAFTAFLAGAGIAYRRRAAANAQVLTPMGTVKPTYAVPASMWAGVEAYEKRAACLIVGIAGLKGFSARLVAENTARTWPAIRAATVDFPDSQTGEEVFAERIAWRLESSAGRETLAALVAPHLKDARVVGLPAVLGIHRPGEVFSDLQQRIGVSVFEIPTMPPSVVGLRIKEAALQALANAGVQVFSEQRVSAAGEGADRGFVLTAGKDAQRHTIETRAVILAGGRFLGGGLRADRRRIREPLFDLPVHQAPDRATWHRDTFLDPKGHRINRAGIETDEFFRPLDRTGAPAHPALFAAGSILAHQDWMRQKCGAGLAVSTARAAVHACLRLGKSTAADRIG
jgi:glycerol-3-phosphate dehydrogenase subunit B